VFKNRVLKEIFGHKLEDIRGGEKYEELHDLYFSPPLTGSFNQGR